MNYKKAFIMLKTFMTLMLAAFMFIAGTTNSLEAKTKRNKNKSEISKASHKKKKKSKGKYQSSSKRSKKRKKKSGNGPDLRALTTETPNTEYTEIPDNGGVNSVEKKTGL